MSVLGAFGIMGAGLGVGIFSALFGVGGGLIMVPFIAVVLDEPQHLALGTSLLVIVPTAVSGTIAHRRRNFVSMRDAALLAVGGMLGSAVGALAALEISGDTLRKLFAAFVAVMGVRLIVTGLRAPSGRISS